MTQHDVEVYLGHMVDAGRRIQEKTMGMAELDFIADDNLVLAVTHLIQIIGEAANQVPVGFQSANPSLPWADIIGMRHKVVHHYAKVDPEIIWKTVQEDIGPLLKMLEGLI